MKIRDDDQLREVSSSLNELVDRMNQNLYEIQDAVKNAALQEGLSEESRQGIEEVNTVIRRRFKLRQDSSLPVSDAEG